MGELHDRGIYDAGHLVDGHLQKTNYRGSGYLWPSLLFPYGFVAVLFVFLGGIFIWHQIQNGYRAATATPPLPGKYNFYVPFSEGISDAPELLYATVTETQVRFTVGYRTTSESPDQLDCPSAYVTFEDETTVDALSVDCPPSGY